MRLRGAVCSHPHGLPVPIPLPAAAAPPCNDDGAMARPPRGLLLLAALACAEAFLVAPRQMQRLRRCSPGGHRRPRFTVTRLHAPKECQVEFSPLDADLAALGVDTDAAPAEVGAAPSDAVRVAPPVAKGLLLVSAALYGTNFSAVKVLQQSLPASTASAGRFLLATFCSTALLGRGKGAARDPSDAAPSSASQVAKKREALLIGLLCGVCNAFGYISQAASLGMGASASKSSFLCSMTVVLVPVLDQISGRQPASRQHWLAILTALLGVAMLELGGVGGLDMADLLGMVQPVAFALGFVVVEEGMRRHPESAAELTVSQLFGTAVVTLAWWGLDQTAGELLGCGPAALCWMSSPLVWLGLAWTGVMTTALTIYLETVALGSCSAQDATLLLTTEPLWALLFANALLGEHMGTPAEKAGALLVLLSCVSCCLSAEHRPKDGERPG